VDGSLQVIEVLIAAFVCKQTGMWNDPGCIADTPAQPALHKVVREPYSAFRCLEGQGCLQFHM